MASELTQIHRRPTRVRLANAQRNSNVVRASVLETALELGIGQNSTVANWIFNNPLSEEPEDPHPESDNRGKHEAKLEPGPDTNEASTPTYTSGSNSTSDESCSLNSPANNAPSAAVTIIQALARKPSVMESPHVHFGDFSLDQLQLFSPFTVYPHDVCHGETKGNPLGNLFKDTERSHSQDDGLHRNLNRESPSPGPADAGYASEGQYLSKGKVGKGNDKPGKPRGNKGSKSNVIDVGKISEKDGDYVSDGGYLSASSNKSQGKSPGKVKSRAMAFFRRRGKRTGRVSDDEDEDSIPPVPAIPILPRPSSPKPLERRAAPSSPTRSSFSPLKLNLATLPGSPPRQRMSNTTPPVHARAPPPYRPDRLSVPQPSDSSLVASTVFPAVLNPTAAAATIPLPHSMPGTPLSAASFPASLSPPTLHGTGTGSTPKTLTTSSSRQHLNIPPPAPPPTLPLPQPPPSPSTSLNVMSPPRPATPTTPSRRGAAARPIPIIPTTLPPVRPLTPRRVTSPPTPLPSPGAVQITVSHDSERPNGPEANQHNSREIIWRRRAGTPPPARLGGAPAFLQRKIQHGPPPSPRGPPPDVPLPPSPCPVPSVRPHVPIGSSSKFHEHFSSVSSVPLSHVLSTSVSMSPSPSISTLSGSSSGPSVRSSHVSSASDRSEGSMARGASNILTQSRPTTSTSTVSEASYGQPITSTFNRPAMKSNSQFSDRSDASSSIYAPTTHNDSNSVTTYDRDDTDVDDAASKSYVDEEDDDVSIYPSEEKTAGRRTMYLVEHGELDVNGEVIVNGENHHWRSYEMPPLPPMPPVATRPGPGYF